jgi:hypothetical protein
MNMTPLEANLACFLAGFILGATIYAIRIHQELRRRFPD